VTLSAGSIDDDDSRSAGVKLLADLKTVAMLDGSEGTTYGGGRGASDACSHGRGGSPPVWRPEDSRATSSRRFVHDAEAAERLSNRPMSGGRTEPGSPPGPKVFISYRREDTAAHAGRLYDAMVARFGQGNVFMDVDMAPGVDFVERITEAVAGTHVLIVVMGPRWATVADEQGRPRIADPEDFVRLEVETALKRPDVTPIPVLVAGARVPNRDDLPPEVQSITRRNAIELSDGRWGYDVGRLIAALDRLLADISSPERSSRAEESASVDASRASGENAPTPTVGAIPSIEAKPTAARGSRRTWLQWALIGAVLIIALVVAIALLTRGGGANGSNEDTDYEALLKLLPANIRPTCRDDPEQRWMIIDAEATAQALCGSPNSDYYLTYGLWPSSIQAHDWLSRARDPGTVDCRTSTTEAIKNIIPRATTGCEDKVGADENGGEGIGIWWNEDGSRVAAWFFWPNHDQDAALMQWKTIATAS
jgi:TIR domain